MGMVAILDGRAGAVPLISSLPSRLAAAFGAVPRNHPQHVVGPVEQRLLLVLGAEEVLREQHLQGAEWTI